MRDVTVDPFVSKCWRCWKRPSGKCAERHWLIDLEGFGQHVVPAPSAAAARYRSFKDAREAGYFHGRSGFHDFLCRCGRVEEVRV